jgi:hypothetical protein
MRGQREHVRIAAAKYDLVIAVGDGSPNALNEPLVTFP